MSDNVTDEYSVPLTKQPKQSKKKSTSYDTKTDSSDTPPKRDTPNKKPRKPKTEKQMEQFKKVIEARKKSIEDRKLQKKVEASKFLLEQGYKSKKKGLYKMPSQPQAR